MAHVITDIGVDLGQITDKAALTYYKREPGYTIDGVVVPPLGTHYGTGPSTPAWQALTVYTAGQLAADPSTGVLIRRITAGTSRATFDSTEQALWTEADILTPAQLAANSAFTATYVAPSGLDAFGLQPRGLALTKMGPVLRKGTAAWEANLVESPSVIWDPHTQRLVMTYVGYSDSGGSPLQASAGLAYSNDGITWTRYASNPILGPSGVGGDPDENGTSGPVIYYDSGTYYLFYIGLTATGYEAGTKRMCVATATAPEGPWTRHGAIISPSGSAWRSAAIWHASIVKKGSTYYLFFNATGTGSKERIGYATATSLLGPWTVDDANSPLIDVGTGTWDGTNAGDPSVYRVGDTWFMAYYGFDGTKAYDGVAFTTDASFPLGWTKHATNPQLSPGPVGSYDETYAHKPFILPTPGGIFHYYTGVGNAVGRHIALAVDSPAVRLRAAVPNLTPRVFDSFNRSASTTAIGKADTGQAWTADAGTWGIINNQAYLTAATEGFVYLDAGRSDGIVSAKIATLPTGGDAADLLFRYVSTTEGWWVEVLSTGEVDLIKRHFGDTAVGTTAAGTCKAGDTISVALNGNSISVRVNGTEILSTSDSVNATATKCGFRHWQSTVARWDDFSVFAPVG